MKYHIDENLQVSECHIAIKCRYNEHFDNEAVAQLALSKLVSKTFGDKVLPNANHEFASSNSYLFTLYKYHTTPNSKIIIITNDSEDLLHSLINVDNKYYDYSGIIAEDSSELADYVATTFNNEAFILRDNAAYNYIEDYTGYRADDFDNFKSHIHDLIYINDDLDKAYEAYLYQSIFNELADI